MDNWDGEFDENLTLQNGRWVNGSTEMADAPMPAAHAQPNEFYQQIYKQATPLLIRIINNNADSDAINQVKELNGKILAHNIKEKLPAERQ
jgi:hypothetical protein